MGRNRSVATAVLVLLLAAASTAALAAKSKGFEQGTWKVTVTPVPASAEKGEKEFEDTLILHKGKFRSTACEAYGFGESPYRIEENNWLADTHSEKEGKNHWHGEVTGDSVSGQMTWTKPDGSVMNYTFTGTRVSQGTQSKGTKKSGK